jgi:hypothetical protein
MARDHLAVELKYARAAVEILRDPERSKKLGGWFFLNFGSREFQEDGSDSVEAFHIQPISSTERT